MKKIDWTKVSKRPWLVLLTAETISVNSPIMMADFRDTHALYHEKIKRFVGLREDGIMSFGLGEPVMIDGIWYIKEDVEIWDRIKDIPAKELSLSTIGGSSYTPRVMDTR